MQTAARNQTKVAAGWSCRGGAKLCQSVDPFRWWGGREDSHHGAVRLGPSGVPGRDERAAAARHFGVSRESVRKMLAFSVALGYRRTVPVRRPKLDGFSGLIDE